MNSAYILALLLLCIAYVACLFLMKHMRNFKLFNFLFGCFVYIPYVMLCIIVYTDVGFHDWNFQNTLPVSNVSPFMFSLLPLLLILPKRLKKHLFLLISLLSVGMFLSTVLGCIYNASIGYKFHFHFLLDYIAHFSLSLFGIYLIQSKQVELTLKNCLVSSSIILCTATVMLVLNLFFDTAFFGLSLRGKHNIYNNVIVDNSFLSALLYYVGLTCVLLLGYGFCKLFIKDNKANDKSHTTP